MVSSTYLKEVNLQNSSYFPYRGKISIAISASPTSIELFKIPAGYNFYMFPLQYNGNSQGHSVLMNNLTTSGAFSATFTNAGEYFGTTSGVPNLSSIYTNGIAANNPRSFTMSALFTTRTWQTSGSSFSIRYTNTTTAFTLALIVNGFLVPA